MRVGLSGTMATETLLPQCSDAHDHSRKDKRAADHEAKRREDQRLPGVGTHRLLVEELPER